MPDNPNLPIDGTDRVRTPDVYDVVVDGKIIGRNKDPDERRKMMANYRGPPATVATGRQTQATGTRRNYNTRSEDDADR